MKCRDMRVEKYLYIYQEFSNRYNLSQPENNSEKDVCKHRENLLTPTDFTHQLQQQWLHYLSPEEPPHSQQFWWAILACPFDL